MPLFLLGAPARAVQNYFGRSDANYLILPGGLTDTLRAQLANAGIRMQATDVANPCIQVFKSPYAIPGGTDNWIIQYTGWIDSATPLDLHTLQDRWTTAIVLSMIQSGVQLSDQQIRTAINNDSVGGASRYATERLRTASGAPNFSPMPPPSGASSWFNNQGAIGAFTNTNNGNGNTGSGGNNGNGNTGGGNGNTGSNGNNGNNSNPGSQQNQQQSKSSVVVPAILVASAVAAALYIQNKN